MTIEQQVMLYLMIAGTVLSALLALGCGYLVLKHPAHPFRRRLIFISAFGFVNAVFVGLMTAGILRSSYIIWIIGIAMPIAMIWFFKHDKRQK
jgi:hypothetical protein